MQTATQAGKAVIDYSAKNGFELLDERGQLKRAITIGWLPILNEVRELRIKAIDAELSRRGLKIQEAKPSKRTIKINRL